MNLDDHLRATLHDDHWALPVPLDALDAVRRKRALRQRTRAAAAVLAVGGLVTGGVVTATALAGGPTSSLQPADDPTLAPDPTSAPGTAGTCAAPPPVAPVPGSTPAYQVKDVRDWFQTQAGNDSFYAGYQQPSPGPSALVPSPVRPGPLSGRLVDEVLGGGVPTDSTFDRDEASSGRRGEPAVAVRLPDGRTLYVNRIAALAPLNVEGVGGDTGNTARVAGVPGTGCMALLYGAAPDTSPSSVTVVTPDGLMTSWLSEKVPLSELKNWAFAAAQWAGTHPAS